MKTMAQIKVAETQNKKRWLSVNPQLNEASGIYILTREEDGYKFCYVGQARRILSRLAQHLSGFQWIDLSLKKHGLFSQENPLGWKVAFFNCAEADLDRMEKEYIKKAVESGHILRNLTLGGQGEGKQWISGKSTKGYRDGLAQGYKNARRDVAQLFEKNLTFSINGAPNKNKQKAYEKFADFINEKNDEGDKK